MWGRFSHHALTNLSSDGELGLSLAPFAWRDFPCLRDLAQDKIRQFDCSLIGWKMPSRSHGAPQFGVQGFEGVLGVKDAPHSDGKGEERDDMFPVFLEATNVARRSTPPPPESSVVTLGRRA